MSAITLKTIYSAVDKFSAPLKAMERASNRFSDKLNQRFTAVKGTIFNLQNQVIGLAGALSIGAVLSIGSSAITKYEDSLASLSAITGVTGKDFDKFKAQVIDVASQTKKSAYETAKAFEIVGSAQPELLKDAKALAAVSKAAIILSKASGDDLETAAKNVTGVLNQFGKGAESADRAINVLSAGAVVGAATISEVTEAMKNSGAVMASANMTMEQSVALLEVLGKFQIKGAEAGTKARGVILKLQQAQLGYKSGIFNINDAIDEANSQMKKYTSAKEKDAFMAKVFGAENITAGKIILANKGLLDEYTKGVTGTNSAYDMAATMTNTFSNQLKELKASFENIVIKGSETTGVLKIFSKVIGFVSKHLKTILGVIGLSIAAYASYAAIMMAVRAATVAYNIVLGIFFAFQNAVPVTMATSKVAMNSYAIATKVATAAQWLWNAALTANPIGLIIVGVGLLIAGIVLMVKHWDKVRDTMKRWRESAVFQILSIVFPILKIVDLIAFLSERWKAIKAIFKAEGIVAGFKAIGRALLSFMLKPLEVILGAISKIPKVGKLITPALDKIENFRSSLDAGLVDTNQEAKKAEETKPVNLQATKTRVEEKKIEEVQQQKLNIELTNRSDKNAYIKEKPSKTPITTTTW